LHLPEDDEQRIKKLSEWYKSIGAYDNY